MTSKEFEDILQRYLQGTCTRQEKHFIEEWYARLGGQESFELNEQKKLLIRQKLVQSIASHLAATTPAKLNRWKPFLKIAATFIILALCTFLVWNKWKVTAPVTLSKITSQTIEIINAEDYPKLILLTDGSKVVLQPHSELTYPATFAAQREVHLTGEAFFEVKRDEHHPFLVLTNEITTKVLGTSFRIKAYKEEKEITVSVKTGKVSVFKQLPGKEVSNVVLIPNQKAVFDRSNSQMVKKEMRIPEHVVPQQVIRKQYEAAPVAKIFEDMEKDYGVDIQFDSDLLSTCTLTTSMVNENLYQRIDIICKAIGAQYVATDTFIVVESKSCK